MGDPSSPVVLDNTGKKQTGQSSNHPTSVLQQFPKTLLGVLVVLLHDPLPVEADSSTAFLSEKFGFWENAAIASISGLPMVLAGGIVFVGLDSFKTQLQKGAKANNEELKAATVRAESALEIVKSELKADNVRVESSVKSELKADIVRVESTFESVKSELKSDIVRVESGKKVDIVRVESTLESVKSELKAAIVRVESGLKADIVRVESVLVNIEKGLKNLENSMNMRFETLIGSLNVRLEVQDQKVEYAVKELALQKRENELEKKQQTFGT
jgi:hypothetical protein